MKTPPPWEGFLKKPTQTEARKLVFIIDSKVFFYWGGGDFKGKGDMLPGGCLVATPDTSWLFFQPT